MKSTNQNRPLAWILALLFAGMPQMVLAQSDSTDEPIVLEEVIVIGEKMRRNELDTASSISAVTGDTIKDRSLESISDIIDQTPNISTDITGGNFRIRGISNSSVTGGGDGGLATVYIDGAPLSEFATLSGPKNTWDLQTVEIFRGAQSTNLGRDSLAGAIIIRTADPTYENDMKARVRVEDYGGFVASAAVNIPVAEDKFAIRIAGETRESDGFVTNTNFNDDSFGFTKSQVLRAKLLFEPNADLKNIITLGLSHNERGDTRITGPNYFDRISTANIKPLNELDQFIATWEADYSINDTLSFSNVVSYNTADFDEVRDDDGTSLGGINSRSRISEINTLTQEARLFYSGDRLDAAGGFYFAKEEEDNFRTIATGLDIARTLESQLGGAVAGFAGSFYNNPFLLSSVDRNDDVTTNYAAFVNVDYDINPTITINVGLRYDRESKEFNGGRTVSLDSELPNARSVPGDIAPVIAFVNDRLIRTAGSNPELVDTTYDAWLPSLGAVFTISDDFSATLQAKRAYRAGGGGTSLLLGNYAYDPEFAWTYEAGIRKYILDRKGFFKANAFLVQWDDMQVLELVPSGGGDFFISNAAASRLKGIEAEFVLDVSEQLSLFAGAGYTDTEFTTFVNQLGNDLSGNSFPFASDWTLSAGGSWKSGSGLLIQADINYLSDAPTNAINTEFSDSRTLVNGKVGYQWGRYEINAFVRNLADAEYVSNTTDDVVRVGAPRMVGVEFRMEN